MRSFVHIRNNSLSFLVSLILTYLAKYDENMGRFLRVTNFLTIRRSQTVYRSLKVGSFFSAISISLQRTMNYSEMIIRGISRVYIAPKEIGVLSENKN